MSCSVYALLRFRSSSRAAAIRVSIPLRKPHILCRLAQRPASALCAAPDDLIVDFAVNIFKRTYKRAVYVYLGELRHSRYRL